MEEKIAELTAKIAELEASSQVTNTMFAETYYYLTIPLMVLIHAGFLAYEMGMDAVVAANNANAPQNTPDALSAMLGPIYWADSPQPQAIASAYSLPEISIAPIDKLIPVGKAQ